MPLEVAAPACTPSPLVSVGSKSTGPSSHRPLPCAPGPFLRKSPRARVSPQSPSSYRCQLFGKSLFDPNNEEELGNTSDDDDESWHLSSSDSVISFSSSSSMDDGLVDATIVDDDAESRGGSDELLDKLNNLFGTFSTLALPVDSAPSSDEVIWHKGLGFILDEQPRLVTGTFCGGIYRGTVDQNGLPNGIGYLVYNNDVYYFGSWKNGLEEGPGMLAWADGSYTVASFEQGVQMTGAGAITMMSDVAAADLLIRHIHYWPSKWFEFVNL